MMFLWCRRALIFFWMVGVLAHCAGGTVSLVPFADTTLIQIAPDNNLGGADFFNAGTTRNGFHNRALLLYDIAGSIPANSLITSVSLTLELVRQPIVNPVAGLFGLHSALRPWGEGVQGPEDLLFPGRGSPALTGEATWNSRLAFDSLWGSPGGAAGLDFTVGASATTFVLGIDTSPFTFDSTAQLVSDVQRWLDQPGANFGWMLMAQSEEITGTARSFASRESPFGPMLTIEFTPVPEPRVLPLLGLALGALAWWLRRRI